MSERRYLVLDCETKGEIERNGDKAVFRPAGCWPRIFQAKVSNEAGTRAEFYIWDLSPESLQHMADTIESVDLVTGYAIDGFDVPAVNSVLSEILEIQIDWPKTADLLRILSNGGRFYKLNDVLSITMGLNKTGSGKDAPTMPWWQLVSYGTNDVHLEDAAFRFVLQYGYLIVPGGYQRAVPIPGWNDTDHVFRYDPNAKKQKPPASAAQMRLLGEHFGDAWPQGEQKQRSWLERNMRPMRQVLLSNRPNKYQASEMIDWFNNNKHCSKKAS